MFVCLRNNVILKYVLFEKTLFFLSFLTKYNLNHVHKYTNAKTKK
jgi:hypothetical protein